MCRVVGWPWSISIACAGRCRSRTAGLQSAGSTEWHTGAEQSSGFGREHCWCLTQACARCCCAGRLCAAACMSCAQCSLQWAEPVADRRPSGKQRRISSVDVASISTLSAQACCAARRGAVHAARCDERVGIEIDRCAQQWTRLAAMCTGGLRRQHASQRASSVRTHTDPTSV